MFQAALSAHADFVSVTSFNEWGEGTQIESAQSVSADRNDVAYLGYDDENPVYYLQKTAQWGAQFRGSKTTHTEEL
jgi:glycoprotein endo-alpha-1,2-mannosidase